MRGHLLLQVALGLTMLMGTTAVAQDPVSDVDPEPSAVAPALPQSELEARAHFRSGSDYFDAGDYADAAREFDLAYELSGRPALLYNVYLAHERLGNLDRAVEALSAFLEEGDPGERAGPLGQRLQRLRERREAELAEERAAAERERVLREAAERDAGPAPWIVAGSGGAVAVAGVVLLFVARADVDRVENPGPDPRWEDVSGAYDRAPVVSTIGAIALGVGGAALVGGLVWGLVSRRDRSVDVAVGPGSLSMRGQF